MAISRTALVALMLPVPAVAYLVTTVANVDAGSQCLASAQAVHDAYPGAWASWSTHVSNHHGVKCWYPVARESRSHHVDVAVRQAARRQQHRDDAAAKEETKGATRETTVRDDVGTRPAATPAAATDAYAAQRNDLTWTTSHAQAPVESRPASPPAPAPTPSSFEERFSAAHDTGQRPSLIQHMMDPVGVVPESP